MQCEICGKEVKQQGMKAHIRLAHPPENPMILELKARIAELEQLLESKSKSVEDIARILYEDIVKPLGEEKGFSVEEWGSFDPADYLKVARKIKG